MKFINILLICLTISSCSTVLTNIPQQEIFLFKDKDGIYLFNPATKKETIVFKVTNEQIFLDEPYQLENDTLIVGIKGELTSTYTSSYFKKENYFKSYYSVALKSGDCWVSEKILYELENEIIKITSQKIDQTGTVISQTETIVPYESSSFRKKGVIYNDFKPRFYSESTAAGKTVFSYQGNIFLVEKSDTTKIVNYTGGFDPKFGSGFLQPALSPTGDFVLFRYLPGLTNFKEETSLQKVDISTKQVEKLKEGEYGNPLFSSDGQFILFERKGRFDKKDCWVSDIYILDLKTLKEQKVGVANSVSWKQ